MSNRTPPEKTSLDNAADHTHKQLDLLGGDASKLSVPLQTVAILYTVQAMIDNGGFRYIFETDFPFQPPYSLFSGAYRRIGALRAAACLDRAVAMFPFPNPHQSQQQRNDFMDSLDESHQMFELGDESVWAALESYVKSNASAFLTV
jgi:hypothetical protein